MNDSKNNTLIFKLCVLILALSIVIIKPRVALAYIDVYPINVKTGYSGSSTEINIYSNSTVYSHWRCSGNWDNGSWFQGNTQYFGAGGIWYLHVKNSSGETAIFGPYIRDDAPPNVPTITASSTGWVNKDVSVSIHDNGDNPGVGYDSVNDIHSSYASGIASTWWHLDNMSWQPYSGTFTESGEGWYNIYAKVYDKVSNSSSLATVSFGIDKTSPSGIFNPNNQSWTDKDITLSFTPTDIGGSRVKQWKYRCSNDDGKTWGMWSGYFGDTSSIISLKGEGIWKIQCEVTDNAGNVGEVYSGSYQIFKPIPTTSKLEVTKYDYKQDENSYWVKPESIFGITTSGYFPSMYEKYPSRTYLMLALKGNTKTSYAPQEYSDIKGKYDFGSDFKNELNAVGNDVAVESSANGNNILTALHQFTAKNDGSEYKLYSKSSYVNKSGEYSNDYVDSRKWIKVDGIAPGFKDSSNVVDSRVSTIINLDKDLNVNARIDNLFDIGSGVNSVYARMYPEGRIAEAKEFKLSLNQSGNWILPNINAANLFNSSDLYVDIYTKDNVGNIGKIASKHLYLLTVYAQIVPFDDQNFTEIPTLQKGQKAVLKIYTTGYPDKLKITFPEELSSIDSSLNKTMQIVQQAHAETDVIFNVPRNIKEKQYIVNVQAINSSNGAAKEAYPEFNVSNDILDGFRTCTINDNP